MKTFIYMIFKPKTLQAESDFDLIKKMVYLYSCHREVQGTVTKSLRGKLVELLSIYVKYGFNSESKELGSKALGVKMININSLNFELRKAGYLIQDKMNTKVNHLSPSLEILSDYLKEITPERDYNFLFSFIIDEEGDNI